jgi:ElaA protein
MNYTTICKAFNDLTVNELYDLLRLRSEIFVVEQNCVFLDMDNKDQLCHHLLLYDDKVLVAYARLLPPDIYYTEASIGRVITSISSRGTGTGKVLMREAIAATNNLYKDQPIRIGAQLYALKFYERFGFHADGDVYVEDGIDHVEMILRQV